MNDPFAPRTWRLAHGRSLELGPQGRLMAIVNVTPDSFSDGGRHDRAGAVAAASVMTREGADVIDVGGESTRPGAQPVDAQTEAARVLPVMEHLRDEVLLSVDTYRASTAARAVEAGAHVVNDVTGGLHDADMLRCVADTGAALVAMHNSREPYRRRADLEPVAEQRAFADDLFERTQRLGIEADRVVVDPGIGFGKGAEENLLLLRSLADLCRGPFALALGASRKRFVGAVTGRDVDDRDAGTAATTALGRAAGAALFRVHAVAPNRDAVRMADAVRRGAP